MKKFKKPLIILEMANNHMGDLNHSKKIIDKFKIICSKYKNFEFALKFQYRCNKTFIHPNFKSSDDKYVKRFEDTFFSDKEWKKIRDYAKKNFY